MIGTQRIVDCRRRGYVIDGDAFRVLTSASAYVLGFIAADGNLHKRCGRLKISNADRGILERIREALHSTHPIVEQRRSVYRWYDLVIVHAATYRALIALGITPNKSLTILFPSIPSELLPHFVRGYFDGNGAVRLARGCLVIKFTSGSPKFLEGLAQAIASHFRNRIKPVVHDPGVPSANRVYFSGLEGFRLGEWMYAGAGNLYLPGKRSVFDVYRLARALPTWTDVAEAGERA